VARFSHTALKVCFLPAFYIHLNIHPRLRDTDGQVKT
jgi:hypothetical protein